MNSRIFARLRSSICVAVAASSTLLMPQALAETSQAILWKVEKADTPASWILATVNTTDARVANFPGHAEEALSSAKHIGTEYHNDMNSVIEMAQSMLTPKPSLAELIGKANFDRLVPMIAERGYPVGVTAKLKPWAAMMLLLSPRPDQKLIPMDDLLLKHAMENQKKYFGIETVEQQLAPYQALSAEQQLKLLDALIKSEDKLEQNYKKVITAYLAQDLDQIQSISKTSTLILPKKDQVWFNTWQSNSKKQRTQLMIDRLKIPLDKGDTFVGISAAYLPGNDGVLASLRAAGYTVTAVQNNK